MPGWIANIGYGEEVTTRVDHSKATPYDCLAWAAIVFSTSVKDDDGDGLPDKLEDSAAYAIPTASPARPACDGRELEAQGSVRRARRDESEAGDRVRSIGAPLNADTAQVVDGAGHNHLPTPAVLKMVGDCVQATRPSTNPDGITGIRAHFDVGPAYTP